MCELGWRLGVVFVLVALVAGGCASSTATSPPPSSDTANRSPATESPSNFASPTDLFHRYPTMRRQEL
jgi:hypothetical protein